ncbi:MAG: DUF2909 domain-containing protein [Gammaproteobacteria bacterium]|nr:MAG: DUF2909 domain-containing protein [Gammaproteobacteria bacterium]
MIKALIIIVFVAILISLGRGFTGLMSAERGSQKVVNALTVRIVLSVLLFILLFVAWSTGQIQPHGIVP